MSVATSTSALPPEITPELAGTAPGARQPLQGRVRETVFWIGVAVAMFAGVFVLQFMLPLKAPVYSPAYTAGANNRVGAVMAALISCATAAACLRWKFGTFDRPAAPAGIPVWRGYLYGAIAAAVTVAALLGVLMTRADYYYADAGYFLTQLRSGMIFHRHLYSEVEFAYGPFLYIWPATFVKVLGAFGVSMNAAYVLSLILLEAIGTALLFLTVTAMPLARRMKIAAFGFFVIVTLDPQEGLNYTAFRFILPALGVVLLSRQRSCSRAALFAAAAAAFHFAVSPELGVAFTAAAVVFGLYRAFLSGRHWMLVAAGGMAGAAAFLLLAGPAYLHTLREFAKGGYNMMLEPVPHIYLLLLCAGGLAPIVVADSVRREVALARDPLSSLDAAGMLLGMYIAGLALLPAALGRCDPLHVAYNGWPLYLLSFLALDRAGRSWKAAGVSIAVLFGVYSVLQECALGSNELRTLLLRRTDPYGNADLRRLRQAVQGGTVAFPFNKPLQVIDGLIAAGEYQPLYLAIPPVDAAADARTIADMRSSRNVAVPLGMKVVTENPINNTGIKFRFRFGYVYKQRYAPFFQNLAEVRELSANWHPAGTFGAYRIYAKNP